MKIDIARNFNKAVYGSGIDVGGAGAVIDQLVDRVEGVAERLGGLVELPERVMLKPGASRGDLASAYGSNICFSGNAVWLIIQGQGGAFDGLVAHELSHVSDCHTKNPARYSGRSLYRWLVAEGKAEHLGKQLGGVGYELLCHSPSVESDQLVKHVVSGGKNIAIPLMDRTAMRVFGNNTGAIYAAGHELVALACAATEMSIFDIHPESPKTIVGAAIEGARALGGKYEATA